VRRALIFACYFCLASVCAFAASEGSAQSQPPSLAKPAQQTSPPQNPAAAQSAAPQSAAPFSNPSPGLRVVVLDPAHGGADTGARGPTGAAEKDIVLEYALGVAQALRAEGLQVVMTRQGDEDPSADDRAAIANAQSNAIFISLHVGSTGPIGTVRTYTFLFSAPFPSAPSQENSAAPGANQAGANASEQSNAPLPPGILLWSRAQEPFVAQSRKLGDLIQINLAQKFRNSPELSRAVPVYGLRSVAEPAVAVEVSSIAADPQQLEAMEAGLADGIARAVAAYKTIYPPGGR
jgi:N-acetylmuramoyl-L-alanine amidase